MSLADSYVAIKGQECETETMKGLNNNYIFTVIYIYIYMYKGEFTYNGL